MVTKVLKYDSQINHPQINKMTLDEWILHVPMSVRIYQQRNETGESTTLLQ